MACGLIGMASRCCRVWATLYHAPDWFLRGLPATPLDGELFMDRKAFQKTIANVRRQDKSDAWKQIRYLIFDAPSHDGTFEERLQSLKALAGASLCHAASAYALHGHRASQGGIGARGSRWVVKGLMLRKPGSEICGGPVFDALLKVKSFKDDEAEVIGHLAGTGRHNGRMGALQVRLADGTEFAIGTGFSDKEREAPPPIGSTVTFKYQELTDGGVPRFPAFKAVREDV